MTSQNLKIAIQKEGRMSEKSIELLKKAGLEFEIFDRSLASKCRNFPLEILFFRAQDIPEMIADDVVDCGICGQNTLAEKSLKLKEIEPLGFGKCRLSIAAPAKKLDLNGKKIATSHPALLKKFLNKNKIKAEIIELSGSVELAPKLKIADAICDLVSSGSTLKINGLFEVEEIFASQVILSAKAGIEKEKKEIFEKFLIRIRSVLTARKYKYVVMNAPIDSLEKIRNLIPGLKNPTVSPLINPKFISIASVVKEDRFWETIEKLKQCGATGILVLPIEKMIL